jgi:ArsR family transcriptional regulator
MDRPATFAAGSVLFSYKSKQLATANGIMRAIAHPLRIKILSIIDEQGSACVFEIFQKLNLEQSIVSQQLRILRNAGLVKTRREGKFINYSIDYSKVENTVIAVNHCNEQAPAEVKTRSRVVKRGFMASNTAPASTASTPVAVAAAAAR